MFKMYAFFDRFNRRMNETSKRLFQNVRSPHAVLLALMTTHIVFGLYGPHHNKSTTSHCQNGLVSLNKKELYNHKMFDCIILDFGVVKSQTKTITSITL